jgi:glutamyl-tRNA reductase
MSSKNLDEKLPDLKTLKKQLNNNNDENVSFKAIQNLIKKLDDQDSKERIKALETLSEGFNLKYPNVIKNSIDAVINSLDNKNEDVKTESVKILLKALENNKINKKNKNKINISLLIHNDINIDTKKNSIDSISNDLTKNKFDDLSENLFDKILLFLNKENQMY